MSNETDKMNYCCDCGWAIRKGFIFKTWYCTCPEIMEKLKKVEISPVNGIKTIEKEKKIECTVLRGQFAYSHLERMPDGRKLCKNYKEKFKGWAYTRIGWGMPPQPPCPPRRSRNPIPALPERVVKTMEKEKLRKFDPMIDEDSPAPEVWTKAVCDDKSCIYRSGLGCDRKWIFITEGGKCGKRMTLDKYKEYMGIKNEKKTKGANK